MMRFLFLLGAALTAPALAAQPVLHLHSTACTLYAQDGMAVSGPIQDVHTSALSADAEVTTVITRGTATFQVDYSGFTSQAQAAFQRAVDIWSTSIVSSVPIRIDAEFAALGASTLGSAGPNLTANTNGLPRRSTWYPFALVDARSGKDENPAPGDFFYDIVAQFSSSRSDWYFGLDGNPPTGQFDFTTVVLHELGHGLGFIGSGAFDNGSGEQECSGTAGTGCWGLRPNPTTARWPFAFDVSVEDSQGRSILNTGLYGNPSNALGSLFQNGGLYLDSPEVLRILGDRGRLSAPSPFVTGSSYSHWDEFAYPRGTSTALMTPKVAPGEAYQDVGDLTCAYMADIGWTLGEGCLDLTVAGERGPGASGFVVSLAGPNPFRGATTVRVARPAAGDLRVTLVDALGREVATLLDGPASAEVEVRVVPGATASGVYRVVVESEGAVRALPLTVVR